MPRVRGFLHFGRRHRPSRPVDPDYGIPEGELPEVSPPEEGGGEEDGMPEHPIVTPPPGIWPPLTPEHPWRPLPGFPERPGTGLPPTMPPAQPGQPLPPQPGQPLPPTSPGVPTPPIALPPGMIWPPLPPGVHGKYLALVLIAGAKGVMYHYTVIDADLRPGHGLPGGGGRPDQGLPSEAEPKR